eukprot:4620656-Karenia_brevis.AAC.1
MGKPQVGCPGEEYPSCVSADTEDASFKEEKEESLFAAGQALPEFVGEVSSHDVKHDFDVQSGHAVDLADTTD